MNAKLLNHLLLLILWIDLIELLYGQKRFSISIQVMDLMTLLQIA